MKSLLLILITLSLVNCKSMKNLPFDQALNKAQEWVGQHDIYAVGESLDKKGEKLILVFANDTKKVAKILPKTFYGHKVSFYETGEILPHNFDKEE